jgi:predicted amidophosphoribosyltransferase
MILEMIAQGLCEQLLSGPTASQRADIMRAAKQALLLVTRDRLERRRLGQARRQYPRTFDKWCALDDQQLVDLYRTGKTLREIATILKRQPRAIKSRLSKLLPK